MKKPNIKFMYSTANLNESRLRSASPGQDFRSLKNTYENVNLVNHIPFADKS